MRFAISVAHNQALFSPIPGLQNRRIDAPVGVLASDPYAQSHHPRRRR